MAGTQGDYYGEGVELRAAAVAVPGGVVAASDTDRPAASERLYAARLLLGVPSRVLCNRCGRWMDEGDRVKLRGQYGYWHAACLSIEGAGR